MHITKAITKGCIQTFYLFSLLLLFLLSACGPAIHHIPPQQTVTIKPGFQEQLTPQPTVPVYRCGAWTSNNIPNPGETIFIYAKLSRDLVGIAGATAKALVHFKSGDITLDQQPTTDGNGYVIFTLPLQGRQPGMAPATVDVLFVVQNEKVQCSAFFTPQ